MIRLTPHPALPKATPEEQARQDFVRDLRLHIAQLNPRLRPLYDRRVAPGFAAAEGRMPADRHEVRHAMETDSDYQLWSLMQRTSQEMGWAASIDTVERDWDRLTAQAQKGGTCGSLRLDPSLVVPRYNTSYDIHLMPGGYHSEWREGDAAAGAIFDLGVYIWGTAAMGAENDLLGRITAKFFRERFPGRKPLRILDLGCTIGAPTVAWARAFPDAEVHGIDVAAPSLRYGHIRAAGMGVPVHFSQQNAEATDFPDGHFDVVVSHILFHETSRPSVSKIHREARRLLAPGGVALHVDAIKASGDDPFMDFMFEWEVDNNNEHFLRTLRDMDMIEEMIAAGFPAATTRLEWAEGEAPAAGEKTYFSVPRLPVYVGEVPA